MRLFIAFLAILSVLLSGCGPGNSSKPKDKDTDKKKNAESVENSPESTLLAQTPKKSWKERLFGPKKTRAPAINDEASPEPVPRKSFFSRSKKSPKPQVEGGAVQNEPKPSFFRRVFTRKATQ